MTIEGYARPFPLEARLGLFTLSAFVAAPLLAFGFAAIFRLTVPWLIPVVGISLLAISFLFGLWRETVGSVAKVGVVLLAVAMAFLSPATMLVGLMYYCGILNSQGGHFHYVCGL